MAEARNISELEYGWGECFQLMRFYFPYVTVRITIDLIPCKLHQTSVKLELEFGPKVNDCT